MEGYAQSPAAAPPQASRPPAATTVPDTAATLSSAIAPTAPSEPLAAPSRTLVPVPSATAADVQTLREDVARLRATLQADIAGVRPIWWERMIPAFIGLAGVLVGGLITWRLQRRQLELSERLHAVQLKETERIGQAKAGHEALSKQIEYQTRRINEFYSPFRFMLRRSGGVRNQLCDQLRQANPQRFVFVTEADGREHLFVVEPNGTQIRFRLISHMHELATQYPHLLPLVNEIVSIGKTMSDLIDTKGGLAVNNNDGLTTLLGTYLAHYSILRDVTDKANKDPMVLATVKYNVAYPNALDAALDSDMAALNTEVEEWRRLSQTMWRLAAPAVATHSGLDAQVV
jgi:hypothetical protein